MGSGPTILRLARGTSALDLDTAAGRAFLQERLAFYNKLCFLLSGGFFLVGGLLMAAGVRPPEEVSAAHDRRAALLHAATLVEVCSHHLHTPPEPPSAPLGRPVPPALEEILLACLEKDPARRPASALALRNAMREVPGVGEWSEEDAHVWWDRWRSRHPRPTESPQ